MRNTKKKQTWYEITAVDLYNNNFFRRQSRSKRLDEI